MFCNQCNSHCADYREDVCAEAQKDYERLLSESRKGVNLTEEEVAKFDQLLHDLVKKGQSVHAVMVNNASLFTFCEKSAYRYVLPKATPYTEDASFDDLTQEDVNMLMSHINSYPRKALKDKTPYDLFTARVGEDVTEKVFGIRKVSPNDVVLKPSLLGTEVKIKEWVLREDSGR